MTFAQLPSTFVKRFNLNPLLKKISAGKGKTAAFIMWGYDLCDCKVLKSSKYPWGTLVGLSWLLRQESGVTAEIEQRLLDIVNCEDSCKGFFQPDYFLRERYEKSVWIPDVEGVELSRNQTPLLKAVREFAAKKLCIGVFGILSGNRCLNEVLLLAREQPKVNFVLAGKVLLDHVDEELRGDLEPGCRDNLLIYPDFIESEEELNAAIRSVDGLFIDGSHYPVQSGIVCRALHFGRWILSSSGNSWTNDVIRAGGVGFTYSARNTDLSAAWNTWVATGGEQRSTQYSMRLRDPLTVAACFDEMAERLLNDDIML